MDLKEFLSLKNVCLVSVLMAIYAAARLCQTFFYYDEYIYVAFGIAACILAWRYISDIVVKWAFYAVSLYAVVNGLPYIFHFHYFENVLGILLFVVICVLGIRKSNSSVGKVDIIVFLAITLVPWIMNCVLRYVVDFSHATATVIYDSVLLVPFVAYILFFSISFKSTSDERLKKCITSSLLGAIGMLVLFSVAIVIGLEYDYTADMWMYHFDGYDWLDNEVTIIASFLAGCMMSAYFIFLFVKSRYTMRIICIPAIIGMIVVGILAAFTVGNAYFPESITRGLEYMSLGYAISSFGIYKLYKKL